MKLNLEKKIKKYYTPLFPLFKKNKEKKYRYKWDEHFIGRSKTVKDNNNPKWNYKFNLPNDADELIINIYDEDNSKQVHIGELNIKINGNIKSGAFKVKQYFTVEDKLSSSYGKKVNYKYPAQLSLEVK